MMYWWYRVSNYVSNYYVTSENQKESLNSVLMQVHGKIVIETDYSWPVTKLFNYIKKTILHV